MTTHYSGRLRKQLDVTVEKCKGRAGKFYEIFNSFGFYDVSDTKNALTPEQRAQVPDENQNRFSDLSTALSLMFDYVLGDTDHGMLTVHTEDIINKLDTRSAMNASANDALGKTSKAAAAAQMSGTPDGVTASAVIMANAPDLSKIMESFTGYAMGMSPTTPDLIPPFATNFPGLELLAGLGELYEPGFFQPDWIFLWNQEKDDAISKFFVLGNAPKKSLRIASNIDVTEGNDIFLEDIFGVVSANANLVPKGSIVGGMSPEDFEIIQEAADKGENGAVLIDENDPDYDSAVGEFSLSKIQLQHVFFKYVTIKLWDVIKDPTEWAHGHWGVLTRNAFPDYIRTAVTSYIWANGLSLVKEKSEESALISYLLTTGAYYLHGWPHSCNIHPIEGVDKILDNGIVRNTFSIKELKGMTAEGLPKDVKLARRYFTWIADILCRLTYSSGTGNDCLARKLRQRRIAEANLVYDALGMEMITYGDGPATIPLAHQIEALKERKFDTMIAITKEEETGIKRYRNSGAPGGGGPKGELSRQTPRAVLLFANEKRDVGNVEPKSINIIKTIFDNGGVSSSYITSTKRPPEKQASLMFGYFEGKKGVNNLYINAGKLVHEVYVVEKNKRKYKLSRPIPRDNAIHTNNKTNNTNIAEIIAAMLVRIKQGGRNGEDVSSHCVDTTVNNTVDLSITNMKWGKTPQGSRGNKRTLKSALGLALSKGWIKKYIYNIAVDPALHIQIDLKSAAYDAFDVNDNAALPQEKFKMANLNLHTGSDAWIACFADDQQREARIDREAANNPQATCKSLEKPPTDAATT